MLPSVHIQRSGLQCVCVVVGALLAVLTATERWYTIQDTQGIVVHHAMLFWTKSHTQYGVLRLLPSKGYIIQLLPIPGTLNSDGNGLLYYL